MLEQIKHYFGNISAEIELFLSKSKNYTLELKEFHTNMNNINSLVDQLRLNYSNLTKDLQSIFEINKQIQLNNKNLTEEIQLISNTSKLHSKFKSKIYQTILKNKLIFQNFSIEKLQSDNKIDSILLKLNKTEQDFKNVTDNLQKEIKKIHNDNDIFEYYISNLFTFVKSSSKFYLEATEHPIKNA